MFDSRISRRELLRRAGCGAGLLGLASLFDEERQATAKPSKPAQHPAVERKLGHLMNRYGNRRARYRGLAKVLRQQLMGTLTANVDRLIRKIDAREGVAFA